MHFGTVVPSAGEFVSRVAHASLIIGSWLYIDGGELQYNGQGESGNPQQEILNLTLALDLSKSWTNDSVTFKSTARGGTPLLNAASLWSDAEGSSFYNFGGWASFWVSWPNNSYNPPPSLWKFDTDNSGGGQWSQQQPSFGFPPRVPTIGLSASGNGVGYYLGGMLAYETYPALNYGTQIALNGMIEFNSSTGSWNNLTSTEVANFGTPSQAGEAAYGSAHSVPIFGPEGITVFFGMVPPFDAPNLNNTPPGNMTEISIFEPFSQTWYTQTAAGPNVPAWRADYCATGVAGDNGTYEIIIHGGSRYPNGGISIDSANSTEATSLSDADLNLDQIYMLSLPSFAWFQMDYPPIASRSKHTCHVVGTGSGQLLTVGGESFHTVNVPGHTGDPDVFSQGLGIFDLEKLAWAPSYNATGAVYRTPQAIKNYVASNPTPAAWNNPGLADVFATVRAPNGSTSTNSPTNSSGKSSSSTGAIVGGVVGGVAALLIIAGLVIFFMRRRRTAKYQNGVPNFSEHDPHDHSAPTEPTHEYKFYPSEPQEMGEEPIKLPQHESAQELMADDAGRTHAYELPAPSPVELYVPNTSNKLGR